MTCPRCSGSGQCIECKGSGSITCATCSGTGKRQRSSGQTYDCSRCKGTGAEACNPRCDPCRGSGTITAAQQKEIHDKYTMVGEPVEARMGFQMVNAILLLNLASFVAQGIVPGYVESFMFLAPAALAGEWWRFLTAQFVHNGYLHIGMNMMFLFFCGPTLESVIGPRRFLFIYQLSGVIGFALHALMSPYTGSLGASGALFGLAGTLMGLQWRYRLFLGSQFTQFVIYSVAWIAFGFLMPSLHIDNWSHLGGGLAGLAFGAMLQRRSLRA